MQPQKITERYHLVNDQSEFQPKALGVLERPDLKSLKRDYHLISIIGSQSSGKSTLLNELFNTTFDVQSRKERIGQTTKGIWFSVDPKHNIFIFDVEGSDSNERQDTRTKIERCNSLFALATSNTLLVNIWTQQLGLFRGSQLAILEIVLELNLKLFRAETPKEILFVVRDFEKDRENEKNLSETIYKKVENVWQKILKPPGTENVKLDDLFHLNTFFLPSFIEEKEEFRAELAKVREFLFKIAKNRELTKNNVLVEDFPKYLSNVWKTIQEEKDLNLPAEKILVANLRCNEIKAEAYKAIEEPLTEILYKAQTTLNPDFAQRVRELVRKALDEYTKNTENYPEEQSLKVREQFVKELDIPIENAFKMQVSMLTSRLISEVIAKFSDVNSQQNNKSIEGLKSIEQQAQENFAETVARLAFKEAWIADARAEFRKQLKETIETGKDKIVIEFLKQLDSLFRKKIEAFVNRTLENRDMFIKPVFWKELQREYESMIQLGSNNIRNKFEELGLESKKQTQEYIERSCRFCYQELKSIVKSKIRDLNYYLNRHFKNDFNFDEKKVPRNWPSMTEEQIDELYKTTKAAYSNAVNLFERFQIEEVTEVAAHRGSMANPRNFDVDFLEEKAREESAAKGDELISLVTSLTIKKKFEEDCEEEYKEAKRKHNEKYTGRIPKWMFLLIGLFMIDDVLVWIKSPYLLLPVLVVVLLVVAVVSLSKGTMLEPIVRQLQGQVTAAVSGVIKPSGGASKGPSSKASSSGAGLKEQ